MQDQKDRRWVQENEAKMLGTWVAPPIMSHVYFIADGDAIKVGVANNVAVRFSGLQSGNPRPLTLLGHYWTNRSDERALHKHFRSHHIRGEWFRDHPELRELIAHKCPHSALPASHSDVAGTRE